VNQCNNYSDFQRTEVEKRTRQISLRMTKGPALVFVSGFHMHNFYTAALKYEQFIKILNVNRALN
jgi:hypothetical protein